VDRFQFESIADLLPQIVWISGPDGTVTYTNQRWADYSGTPSPAESWLDFVHPDDVPVAVDRRAKAIEHDTDFEAEFRLRRADGIYRWHLARSCRGADSEGGRYWVGTCTDIEKNKTTELELARAQKNLKFEKERHDKLISSATSALALLKGPDFIFEKVNKTYQESLPGRELLGRSFFEVLPELKGQFINQVLEKVMATGETFYSKALKVSYRHDPNGDLEDRYFDLTYHRVLDMDEKPYGIFIYKVDVTDKVLAFNRLQESKTRYELALEAAHMGVWEYDVRSGILNCSQRARDILGMGHSQTVTWNRCLDCIDPQDRTRVEEHFAANLAAKKNRTSEIICRVVHVSGQVKTISIFTKSIFLGDEEQELPYRAIGTILDISDRVEAQEQLIQAKLAAESANRAKSFFLANMSHEIRTPLNAIIGFAEVLRDSDTDRAKSDEYLKIIIQNGRALSSLINDVLDMSKVEAGKIEIKRSRFSIRDLMREILGTFSDKVTRKNITLAAEFIDDNLEWVVTDQCRLRQIVLNLIGNAIKFTDGGSISVNVGTDPHSNMVWIDVTDSGLGIAPENQSQLFQPFTQIRVESLSKSEGTGLGLSLSRHLARALGGDLVLHQSAPLQGSTFRIEFPNMLDREAARPEIALSYKLTNVPSDLLKGMNVLIVDDSTDNRLLTKVLLTKYGAQVTAVEDARAAFAKL
jgi:PAS domain S-box-containing protein